VIQVGVVGAVLNGRHPDMKVQIVDDTTDTGEFFVLQWWPESGGLGPEGTFDDWVESRDALEAYWEESGWQVRWVVPGG
jgi:hypothetical protein